MGREAAIHCTSRRSRGGCVVREAVGVHTQGRSPSTSDSSHVVVHGLVGAGRQSGGHPACSWRATVLYVRAWATPRRSPWRPTKAATMRREACRAEAADLEARVRSIGGCTHGPAAGSTGGRPRI